MEDDKEYFSSRTQWRAIGCALGVSAADLEAIKINQRGKCEDYILQVLQLAKEGREKRSNILHTKTNCAYYALNLKVEFL